MTPAPELSPPAVGAAPSFRSATVGFFTSTTLLATFMVLVGSL